ncbi:MAG: IS3 family transposase [Clostridia bacterium]
MTSEVRAITIQDYNGVKCHAQKLENMLEILKQVSCSITSPLQERLAAIEPLYGQQYSVIELCEALDVPRGTFYNHILRNKRGNTLNAQRRETLLPMVKEIFDSTHQVYGGAKIVAVLKEQGYNVGKKLVLSLMAEMGLQSICPQSKHEYEKWKKGENKNVLQQQFQTDAPNKIWASDVTVFKFNDRYYYVCAILDIFSRRIVAYRISDHNSTQLVVHTFKRAFQQRQPLPGLIFHSDRGSQYLYHSFSKLLRDNGVIQSLSRHGKPHDNAVCEVFFAIFKKEELYRHKYRSVADIRRCIDEYMAFYNHERLHSALQYKAPDKYEEQYWGKQDCANSRHWCSD